ncbi:hypothetical protein [Nitratireductor sp. CH_MIT9313-5]|jgi:hypothetical protein|uniref:hypothetical protein n=1 Tax=Nitratireductor sp. CH_MIT9313-5 TaxID=3107764 RepID=UPI003008DAF5
MSVHRTVEAQIDALLTKDDSSSIIETLYSLGQAAGDAASIGDEWDRAVQARLQARLARKMREAIEPSGLSKPASSAA